MPAILSFAHTAMACRIGSHALPSNPAAYGDLIAALLVLVALGAIRLRISWALALVWIFNIRGMADLLNTIIRGLIYIPAGQAA